ncbi:DUF421 domain-containing protein [Selenomonadales bacterium OttesenSCG-928-I06]|nr:DUF421 domain-containing protein [Selenomonadales bacterium OttesenSCG-928-I06]
MSEEFMPTFLEHISLLIRFFVLIFTAFIVVRIMGARTVGQISPFDFIMLVGVGDVVISGAVDNSISVFICILILLFLLIIQQAMGYLALKNITLREWFEGVPVTLIADGQILKNNFKKTHLNFDDLRQELHKQGLTMLDMKDIKLARLESSGDLSIILENDKEPLTKHDLAEFSKNIEENPLSPLGEKWLKIEKMIQDVEYIKQELQKKKEKSN